MSNEVESIHVLAEALRKSCGLFNQLVTANTRLLKLQSPDQPIKRSTKGTDGICRFLTADQAVDLHEVKIDEQSMTIHKVEDDFLAAIKDADRAIKQHNLASALGRSMSDPEEWLDELLAEIECMKAAALWPYYPDKNDSASQWGVMTPERRMGDLIAVQKRLHRLDVMLARRSRLTPTEPRPESRDDKPTLTIHIADMTATLGTVQYTFDQSPQWEAMKKMAHLPGCTVRITAGQATRLRKLLEPTLPDVAKAIYCQHKGRYAIRTSGFLVDVIEPAQPSEN